MKPNPPAPDDAALSPSEQMDRDLPRNYAAVLAHGMLGVTGFRLVNAPTFVPAYIFLLSGSKLAVGLVLAAQYIGMAMSSILGATMIEHRSKVMPVVYAVGWLMRVQILGLALSAYFLGGQAALLTAVLFLALFGFFNGIQSVTFSFLMSKVIPVSKRGRLTGMRNFLGGLTASGVAYLGGHYLVETNAWGNGYASTFLVAFVLTSIGITTMSFVREPASLAVRAQAGVWARFREVPALLRSDPNYARFFVARALAALGTVALPFYTLYAGRHIQLTGANLGYLSLAFLLAQTVSNLLWGAIADRRGYRLVFMLSIALWAASALLLAWAASLATIMLAFCGLGAGVGGYMVASQNFVLEFGMQHERPMLIAISDTASHLMMAIGPLIGGFVAQGLNLDYVIWIAVAVKALSVLAVVGVVEPRQRIYKRIDSAN